MTSATAPSLTLVTSSLDHPDARELADQLDGELASIYGGQNTGRDTAVPADLAAPRGLFLLGYLDDVAVACGGVRLRRDLPHAELTAEIKRMYVALLRHAAGAMAPRSCGPSNSTPAPPAPHERSWKPGSARETRSGCTRQPVTK